MRFFQQAEQEGRIAQPWSAEVCVRVARGLLRALTDFGLLCQVSRTRRELVPYRPSDGALVYLAYDLHFVGTTDSGMVQHPNFGIHGLSRPYTVREVDRLSGEGFWLAQIAGSIVRITWKYATMAAVIDALS